VNDPYVIVWDLDGTVGDFYALEKKCDGDTEVTVTTRPGLAGALRALRQAGFAHSLLTRATPVYAEIALRGTGLRDLFERVECPGQRRKGDAAGVAAAFGIPAEKMKDRMIFVGDRMVFDEPDDPAVVFHLEPVGLTRPAVQLERLVLGLRDAGGGSLREGFLAVGRGARKWYRPFRPRSLPAGRPLRRVVPGLGAILLLEREGECPVIGYEERPDPPVKPDEHRIVPASVMNSRGG
jgi:hypothetical protein